MNHIIQTESDSIELNWIDVFIRTIQKSSTRWVHRREREREKNEKKTHPKSKKKPSRVVENSIVMV